MIRSTSRTTFAMLVCYFLCAVSQRPAEAALGVPVYWVDAATSRLGVVDLDGSGFQVLLTGLANPGGIDIDPLNSHVYFTEGFAGKIRRINFDGSNPVDIVTGVPGPVGLSLDLQNSKIYWTNLTNTTTGPTVQRSNLDGSNVQTLISGFDSIAIEIDTFGNKMYWSQGLNTNATTIRKANLDGSSAQTIFTGPTSMGGTAVINGLTVGYDTIYHPQGRLYFSLQQFTPAYSLESMDLNGGPTTTIATNAGHAIAGTDFYEGFQQVLWANYFSNVSSSGEIWRALPDGSNPQLVSTMGLNRSVYDIAVWPFLPPLVPEPATLALIALAAAALATTARSRGATLVTHNTAEFSRVPGLFIEDWQTP